MNTKQDPRGQGAGRSLLELHTTAQRLMGIIYQSPKPSPRIIRACTERFLGEPLDLYRAEPEQLAALIDQLTPVANAMGVQRGLALE